MPPPKLLSVFILAALVYALLAAFSYGDIIFHFELSRLTSFSDIETGKLASPAGRDALMFLFAAALLYLYVQGFLLLKESSLSKRTLMILAAVLTTVVFFIMPFDSTDCSVYINSGWLQAHYHLNPYACSVTEVANWYHDPMLKQHWVQAPCVYGPLFALLCQAVAFLGSGNYLCTVFILKTINALCHLAITGMILFGIGKLQNEEQTVQSAYLYAFSPFMLMHEVGNAHNDILMDFCTCLAVVLWLNRRYLPVLFSFFAGVAIKYVSIVMLPGMFYLMLRRAGAKKTIVRLFLGLIPIACLFYLYFSPMDLRHASAMFAVINLRRDSLRALVGMWQVPALDSLLVVILGAICLTIAIKRISGWRKIIDEDLLVKQVLNDMVLFQILLVCLFSAHCESWYPAFFFPLAMFLPPQYRVRQFSLLVTSMLVFSILWFGYPSTFMMTMFVFIAFVGSKLSAKLAWQDGSAA